MFYLGCHLSVARGYAHMAREALSIKANTWQFFSRNPRGGRARALDEADLASFFAVLAPYDFAPLMAHAPYTLNPSSARQEVREFARQVMAEDLKRLEHIPGSYYNFHPGSHGGQGQEKGIDLIVELLDEVLSPEQTSLVLLETMAGRGSELGADFAQLKAILARVALPEKLAVCLDTCHAHAAGYDLVHDLEGVLAEFDRVIGLERLRAIHLNDSMNPLGSKKDKHARIGQGYLGLEAISRLINHPSLRGLPFFLETPNDLAGYAAEISLLCSLRN
jgi:deoxyribonuclease-4